MIFQDNFKILIRQIFLYLSLFGITWPSNLGCSTFDKQILPFTKSRPYSAYLQVYIYIFYNYQWLSIIRVCWRVVWTEGINCAGVKWVIRLQLILLLLLFIAVLDFTVGSFVHSNPGQ